ncbi:uncharacterized protein LOC112684605 [Sipha flava]|uniref:Uncharacterized protein LOC112684605 n=1 Tax=Sipha flava TaxID=143950 RepID=A0A8B8FNR6_9HEMI|nr:uncharacterized protein LOC112684605 [Sipha flava]
MDCRGDELIQHNNRASAQAVPFQYLINEQAKSILALQELQNEVGALLEFRELVMDTFPHLRQKQVSSPEPSSGSQGVGSGESRWEPGVRVRRKLGSSSSAGWIAGGGGGGGLATVVAATAPRSRSNSHGKGPKSGEPATTSVGTVQDSGFCTESKDSSSTSSRTTMTKNCCKDEDELWSLLEVIQDKGTKLKLEVEFLQSRLLDDEQLRWRRRRRRLRRCRSLDDVMALCEDGERQLRATISRDGGKWPAPVADERYDYNVFRLHVANLKRERDALLDRVTEMEAESLSTAAQIHRLLAELKSVVCENKELEDRLCGNGKPCSAAATSTARKSSSHNGGGGFAPVQPESSTTGPSSSSAGRDTYYTPSQHSACNLSSIELCKPCSSSYMDTDDDDRHRSRMLLVRPSDPISRNLEGRALSPLLPAVDIGSPTFAKRLGALDGIVSSPADSVGKPVPGCGPVVGTPLPKRTLAAILKTFNPIELQRHLITVSYENKNLIRQLEILSKSKSDVSNELNKSKEDNEELKFQLEEKRIELEGTMARVRLLQLHQEQQQHGPVVSQPSGTIAVAKNTATDQWLDLVPSNPILPQIALPGNPPLATVTSSHHHQNHQHMHHHQDENGGSSSTESAHQARSGSRPPSKIPVVKPSSHSVPRPPLSYREQHHYHHGNRDPFPSWNKSKSDQSSLPRNWESIGKINGGGSSIGSGSKQRGGGGKQDSLQQQQQLDGKQHRARRDSGSGGTSLTRAKSQNHHHQQQRAAAVSAGTKDFRAGGGGPTAAASSPAAAADDTNKSTTKKLFRRRNLVRSSRCLIDNKKTVLPAVDEVQEPPDSMATAAAKLRDQNDDDDDEQQRHQHDDDDDDDNGEFFFDSIESSLATSASSKRPPPECDSIDLSQPDSSLPAA